MSHLVEESQPIPPATDGQLSFLVGLSSDGHWLAVETHGLGGGIFRSQRDALNYAAFETGRRPDAVRLSPDPLDFKL
ncbi:MAG: RAG2 PHD domain containing protein [Methylobacterium sp.]|uniref:RAG2 PHD domain containing protein n=1 Tax=Methylobacterium sp. TaxID=409 RepID=UPI0025882BAF|nr:RAG2 PHD domain containing protein [Methylobacterium sp.]MBY0296239.1 RAG2 PHD domain containing protein [Methylobacterium sp.]